MLLRNEVKVNWFAFVFENNELVSVGVNLCIWKKSTIHWAGVREWDRVRKPYNWEKLKLGNPKMS